MTHINQPIRKMFVYVPFVIEGYHAYPGADTNDSLATGDKYDVSHLALRHFHYFHFKVWIEVTHTNRDIEFIQFKRWLESLYAGKQLEADGKSCEMLADDLHAKIVSRFPNREIRIDVSEDNINGCLIEYTVPIDPVSLD